MCHSVSSIIMVLFKKSYLWNKNREFMGQRLILTWCHKKDLLVPSEIQLDTLAGSVAGSLKVESVDHLP